MVGAAAGLADEVGRVATDREASIGLGVCTRGDGAAAIGSGARATAAGAVSDSVDLLTAGGGIRMIGTAVVVVVAGTLAALLGTFVAGAAADCAKLSALLLVVGAVRFATTLSWRAELFAGAEFLMPSRSAAASRIAFVNVSSWDVGSVASRSTSFDS